jgi:peptide/nickel transport system ATP-binding protein
MPHGEPVLQVDDLCIALLRQHRAWPVVSHVTLSLNAGETLALVGESGCGKSLTALAIMGLLDLPLCVTHGRIAWRGEDLTYATKTTWRRIRGRSIALAFQEPHNALNPVMPIGAQIAEALQAHTPCVSAERNERVRAALAEVGIAAPDAVANAFAHQLSGGMRQRVVLAMALIHKPEVLLLDEPTTALDATTQVQIVELLRRLQATHDLALLFITHDLALLPWLADRACVMYAGRVVETGAWTELARRPRHPYTRALFALAQSTARDGPSPTIPGVVPGLFDRPAGCAFAPRCPRASAACQTEPPFADGVACVHPHADAL